MDSEHIAEKWGKPTQVSPAEKGKYQGKTLAELRRSYAALKKSGPHKKGSTEYGRMRELAFAIRAKTGWGKVGEAKKQPKSPWAVGMSTAMKLKKDEPPLKKSTIAKAHDISRAIMRKESVDSDLRESVDREYQETLARLRELAGL